VDKYPITTAVRFLREHNVKFEPHLYKYEDHGGTARSAAELGVPENIVVKTLVMETEDARGLIVLMHGDREVSTKALARQISAKTIVPCDPSTVQKLTGYQVGGCSPFGTRKALPVFIESTILALPRIYINGGKRGFLVSIDPADLLRSLDAKEVSVAISKE
jgi:Cys-tRNA(Pro) deacylase